MTDEPRVVVLGAGVCGLYAARILADAGVPLVVVEQADTVGGLAAGFERNGNFYDLGVHQLHAFDREIYDDIQAMMGDRLVASEKHAMIRFGDGYRRYPLEFTDLLSGIPPWTLWTAVLGLGWQSVWNQLSGSQPQDAEEALIQLYGRPLYEHFFRDFTHRYWGIPASGLSASFVRTKMPRLGAVDILKRVFGRLGLEEPKDVSVESALAREVLYYSRTGSRELPRALAATIRDRGGEVRLASRVVGLEAEAGRIVAVRYERNGLTERCPCAHVISTIPLPELVRMLEPPAPPAVLAASHRLRYKALAVYGLLVREPRVLDAQFVYYRERVFHRIAEPKNSGLTVTPPDHTMLLVETTCNVGDDRWQGGPETRQRIVRDLEAEGLLIESDIVETHLLRAEHAYPMFELGFEPHRQALIDQLATFANLTSTGRQGAFAYPNMHDAMRMGADAARSYLDRRHDAEL